MAEPTRVDLSRIAQDLQIRRVQVEAVVALLDEGNTVPFIARYRRERTGNLDEETIRSVGERVRRLRVLADRKSTVLRSIEAQGKLTEELRVAIEGSDTLHQLEDLYLPFKPKKRTPATEAREKGLEPLARAVWQDAESARGLVAAAQALVDPAKGLNTPDDVLVGVGHILAEEISEHATARAALRKLVWDKGKVVSTRAENLAEEKGAAYRDYMDYQDTLEKIPSHRVLGLNRGEKDGILIVRLTVDEEAARQAVFSVLPADGHTHSERLRAWASEAMTHVLLPSLEREARRDLTEEAEEHTAQLLARNLRCLLLQPPVSGKRVLAIEPGFRTGCKLAVLDETGKVLAHGVVHPHAPQNQRAEAKETLLRLARENQVQVIAIGDASASRETEELVAEVIVGSIPAGAVTAVVGVAHPEPALSSAAPAQVGVQTLACSEEDSLKAGLQQDLPSSGTDQAMSTEGVVVSAGTLAPPTDSGCAPLSDDCESREKLATIATAPTPELAYTIVNAAGASAYSTSAVGREELPDLDASLRGAVSIGRRMQDPLSELVKIEPQHLGIGSHHHDVQARHLKEWLGAEVESCVNHVGVDLNTAGVQLLRYVSGLNQLTARRLVEWRQAHGPFTRREQLKQVPEISDAVFTQAAGFLKIPNGENPLDGTCVHPESYPIAGKLLAKLELAVALLHSPAELPRLPEKLRSLQVEPLASEFQVDATTLRSIIEALQQAGHDPRDESAPPIFKHGVLKLQDLSPGKELRGKVLNVVDFGAFIDIGLKDSGLVHISQLSTRFIRSPHEVVTVGQVVTVWVLSVDGERRRVSLTMIAPGTNRRPQQRPRRQRGRQAAAQAPAAAPGQPAAAAATTAQTVQQQDGQPREPQTAQPVPARHARPPRPPQLPQRRPRPKPAAPPLPESVLQGQEPMRSFGELKRLWEAKRKN